MTRYAYRRFPFVTPPELAGGAGAGRYPVAIVGAGPIGLALAIDLALHGVRSVVLDDNDVVSVGSRAICWAKRSLEIFDRLGVGERMVEKGVTWRVGRLFNGDKELYRFDLLPEAGHKMPAFINLQQYYVEEYLVDRCHDFPDLIDLRWKNAVIDHEARADAVRVEVATPDGRYSLMADWLVAADGSHSTTRSRMGLPFEGETFHEQFLIVDVEMEEDPFGADGVPERWFWFHPPFHPGQSALLHRQPDNIYRIDLQLGPDADADVEKDPERVLPRIRAIVGDRPFEIDWLSVYRFRCARLDRFVHGRVIFAGDSAHLVSPFGARGGNGGIQDVDNLGWKLAAVVKGEVNSTLLETYDEERSIAADENILNSTRATRFMTPKSATEMTFRDAVLALAGSAPFARRLVNSGRLSLPANLAGCRLQGAEGEGAGLAPGSVCLDAPVAEAGADGAQGWLLDHLGGRFMLLTIGEGARAMALPRLARLHVALEGEAAAPGDLVDRGFVAARYGRDVAYLVRPDQHVVARFGADEAPALSGILGGAVAAAGKGVPA
ncbi:FAD-dependent oxidoreductase [Acuticoccus kandeliae]|uniref:FAD-dependent oxidoreductase n=1 Tax=Acuticoccus kandeliae TaxID=2073160 RepID=UPI000D3EC7F4|nr:FAD-dependent oxidoreductase [Acuticoccus kandeliae]